MSQALRKQVGLRRLRHGAAAVEFAIIAPLFFLLLAGIIEFGQAFRIEHSLSIASRRGARSAIVTGKTTSQVQQAVKAQVAKSLNVQQADITVQVAVNGSTGTDISVAEKGDEILVIVSIPFSKAGMGFYANILPGKTLSCTSIFEHE